MFLPSFFDTCLLPSTRLIPSRHSYRSYSHTHYTYPLSSSVIRKLGLYIFSIVSFGLNCIRILYALRSSLPSPKVERVSGNCERRESSLNAKFSILALSPFPPPHFSISLACYISYRCISTSNARPIRLKRAFEMSSSRTFKFRSINLVRSPLRTLTYGRQIHCLASTPPRRMHASHLHQRSVSRTPSFPTSPPSNRSSPVYSLMRDSPKHPRNRLADSVASASEFVGRRGFKFGKKGDRGKDGGAKRLVVLTVIAIGLLVLAERSWNGEESMFRSGRKMDDFAGLRSMEVTDETRIEKALNYDGTFSQRHKGLSEEELKSRPEEPVDRWIKVSRPAPARLDNPSRPSPEIAIVPSPYTFDPSQRFIFVGWMGEQVRSRSVLTRDWFAHFRFCDRKRKRKHTCIN